MIASGLPDVDEINLMLSDAADAELGRSHPPGGGGGVHDLTVSEIADRLGHEPGQAEIRHFREAGLPDEVDANSTPNSGRPWGGSIAPVTADEGRTDLTNARRFKAVYGESVRYCYQWRRWLVWSGTHWQPDNDGSITRLGKAIADQIWDVANSFDNRQALQFAAKTAGAKGISNMLELVRSELPILPGDLDQNAWLLACPNGTVDLRTGELRKHRREDFITKLCPTEYNPEAPSFAWDRFLEDVFGDSTLIEFVQKLSGYAATGDVREQILPIFWGSGSNGKSTFLEAVKVTLGPDYCIAAAKDLLLAKRGESHPTELADLHGKRLVIAMETENNRTLAESLVKQLTGGDTIKARRMREDFWEFQPTHKLILCSNYRPRVRGQDHAIWRRLKLVPFTNRFDGAERDKSMPDKLRAEQKGILAWIVRGGLNWQIQGLAEPEAVKLATIEYRTSEDVVAQFVADQCVQTGEVRAKAFREALHNWCEHEGYRTTPSQTSIGEWIAQNGYNKRTSNGTIYTGIGLKARP